MRSDLFFVQHLISYRICTSTVENGKHHTKVEHPTVWSDYRPVSLTSNLCKTFERVLAKLIIESTTHLWINNRQHDFLPGRCTTDAIVQVLFDIGNAIDKGKSVISIFFDFA
jgi:hypothetical protein